MAHFAKMLLGATLALGLALPALADTAAPAPTAETVVATVNGTKITLGEMVAMRDQLPAQYKNVPNETLFKAILDQLIQQTLLQQSVAGKLSALEKLELANTERAFVANTVLQGIASAATSDEALKAAYDKQYANTTPGLEYHAAHILVPTEQEAKDIKAKLDAGGDFAALAKEDSKDGSASQGGDLGWFGLGMMVKQFEDAVVALKPGEVSAPVQTQFGWHIIKLIETRPAKKPTLDEVKQELSQTLQQDAVGAKLKTLTDAAKIERTDAGIDPNLLSDTTLVK